MEIANLTPFPVGPVAGKVRFPQPSMTVVIKGTFRIDGDGPLRTAEPGEQDPLTGDLYVDDEPENECLYDSDFAYWKPRTDLMLVGSAYAPGDKPTDVLRVTFGLGGWSKTAAVIGPRVWKRQLMATSMSDPLPFKTMPLTWRNSFGGPKFKANPVGRGREGPELPTIENPDKLITRPGARARPVCFGPVNRNWTARRALLGTYKRKYMKQRWPWFPDDFDWRHFNAAPEDQQLEGYLKGNEELVLVNLHPEHAAIRARLPALRVRAFLLADAADGDTFLELPLHLDTLLVDTDRRRVLLTWRGVADVRTDDLEDVRRILVASEPLDSEPLGPDHYRKELERIEAEQAPAPPEAGTPEEEPARPTIGDAAMKAADKEAAAVLAAAKQRFAAAGVDVTQALAAPEKASFAAAIQGLQRMKKSLESAGPKVGALLDKEIAGLKETEKDLDRIRKTPDAGKKASAKEIADRIGRGESVEGEDHSGLDFSGADLKGAVFRETVLAGANFSGADLSGADLSGAIAPKADFTGARLCGTKMDGADLTEGVFAGADLSGASLNRAELGGAVLDGALLKGAVARQALLPGASLREAVLEEGDFEEADFSGAAMHKASFRRAGLKAASVEGAEAPEVDLSDADLAGLRAGEGANFENGKFLAARADESSWDGGNLAGADFSGAGLFRADFTSASLKKAKFEGNDLRESVFTKADLEEAVFRRANLFQSLMDKAELKGAIFLDCSLYGAEFLEASTKEAKFQGTNLKGTKLA